MQQNILENRNNVKMERQKANADTLISELFRLLHLIYRIDGK